MVPLQEDPVGLGQTIDHSQEIQGAVLAAIIIFLQLVIITNSTQVLSMMMIMPIDTQKETNLEFYLHLGKT